MSSGIEPEDMFVCAEFLKKEMEGFLPYHLSELRYCSFLIVYGHVDFGFVL